MNWIFLALFSALMFGLGDFFVVWSGDKKMDVITLYILYTIIIGIINLIYLIFFRSDSIPSIYKYTQTEWIIVALFCITYLLAYLLHFIAIQKAANPGYASALVMFHVLVLTGLSYWVLSKPLNKYTGLGIILTLGGAFLVTNYSEV